MRRGKGRSHSRRLQDVLTYYNETSAAGDEQPEYSSAFVADVPCNILDVGGREKYFGRQVEAEISTVIEQRWIEGLKHEMIAKDLVAGRTFEIAAIYKSENGDWAEIHATEIRQ
jgi:hypothetical protein